MAEVAPPLATGPAAPEVALELYGGRFDPDELVAAAGGVPAPNDRSVVYQDALARIRARLAQPGLSPSERDLLIGQSTVLEALLHHLRRTPRLSDRGPDPGDPPAMRDFVESAFRRGGEEEVQRAIMEAFPLTQGPRRFAPARAAHEQLDMMNADNARFMARFQSVALGARDAAPS